MRPAVNEVLPAGAAAEQRADSDVDLAQSLRNALKLAGSLVATWGVALAVRLVLPRTLGPAGFGIYNFADAFSTTCFIALTLGVDQYIHKEVAVRLDHASDFLGGVFLLRFLGGALVALGMWGGLILGHRSTEVQETVLLFAGVQLFSLDNDTLSALLHAANRVDGLTVSNIATKLLWGGLLIALATTHAGGLPALAGATLAVEMLRTGWLWILARRGLGLTAGVRLRPVVAVLLASLPFFVTAIAHTAYSKVDATMLAFLSSDAEVGYYGAAANLASLTLLLTPLIGWVFLPLTARAAARSREGLLALMQHALRVTVSLAIPLALGIWLAARDLTHLAFGAAFLPATLTLQVLAPLFVVTYVAIVASTCLIRLDRPWTVTAISLAGLVLTPLLNLLLVKPCAHAFGPGGAGAGAAVSLLITELSVTTAMLIALRGQILSRDNLRSSAASACCAVLVLVLDRALWGLGAWRYLVDAVAYLGLATATGGLRPSEVLRVLGQGLRTRKAT